MTEEINEVTNFVEKDISLPRTVTMPLLMFRLCQKYGISVSEATQEGALMLLRMNDDFMASTGSIEEAYRQTPSKYKGKVESFVATITMMTK